LGCSGAAALFSLSCRRIGLCRFLPTGPKLLLTRVSSSRINLSRDDAIYLFIYLFIYFSFLFPPKQIDRDELNYQQFFGLADGAS
jgi:hypothetical protein